MDNYHGMASPLKTITLPFILLFLAIGLVSLLISQSLNHVDKSAQDLYRSFIETSFQQQQKALGLQAMDNAWWDDGIAHLVESPDWEWADSNIGSYLAESFNIKASLVLAPDHSPLIAFVDGKLSSDLGFLLQNSDFVALIKAAQQQPIKGALPVNGWVLADQQLLIVGAFPFTPEEEVPTAREGRFRSVLVLVKAFDNAFLNSHAKAYNLDIGPLNPPKQGFGIPILSNDGAELARLHYRPPTPSSPLVDQLTLPLLGLGLLLLLCFALGIKSVKTLNALNRQLIEDKSKLMLSDEVLRSTSEAVVITDADARIVYVNDAYSALTGFESKEVLGQKPSIHKSGHHDAAFYKAMWQALIQEGGWKGEIWDRRRNGEVFPKRLSISAVKAPSGATQNYVGVFTDITEQKDREFRLEKMAHYDPLTELPNRRLFQEQVEMKMRSAHRMKAQRVVLLFIDLDHFKQVNDTLGHAAGDQLLIEVANRIRGCFRDSDALARVHLDEHQSDITIARMGGDEFTVALDCIADNSTIEPIIERLCHRLSTPILLNGEEVSISASIGVSVFPDDGSTYDQLINNADKAMYLSKQGGRNQFVFFNDESETPADRMNE